MTTKLVDASVDISTGVPYNPRETYFYQSCMLSDIPNFVFTFGYANASWTLKSDLVCVSAIRQHRTRILMFPLVLKVSKFATDLLNHMKRHKLAKVCPRRPASVYEDPDKKVSVTLAGYSTLLFSSD